MRNLLKSAGLKESLLLVVGNGLSTGVSALALIIFSRLLGPVEFGVFSVGFSVTQLLVRLADGGVNIAVQRSVAKNFESQVNRAKSSIQAATRLKLMITLVLMSTSYLVAPLVCQNYLGSSSLPIVRLAIVMSSITIGFEYVAVLLQSVRRFAAVVQMTLVQALVKLAAAVGMWAMRSVDAVMTFVIYSTAPLVGITIGWLGLPAFIKKPTQLMPDYIGILKVVKYTSVAIVAAAIGDNLDVLLVQGFLSSYETGLFSAGSRLSLLVSVLAYSLGTVLSPRVARYQNKYHFSKYLRKSFLLIGASLMGIAVVVPLSGLLIRLTAGPEYLEATKTVAYLLASGMLVLATTPIVAMFYALDNPEYFAYSGILQTVVLVIANLLLIPIMGIEGAGIARLLTRISVFIFSAIFVALAIKKRFNIRVGEELKVARNLGEIF